jgi:hypothetical protein
MYSSVPTAVPIAQPIEVAVAAGRRRSDPQPRPDDERALAREHELLGGDACPPHHTHRICGRVLEVRSAVSREYVIARQVHDACFAGRVPEQDARAFGVDVMRELRGLLARADVAHARAVDD